MLAPGPGAAEPSAPPSVVLAGANIPRAKALALDAALIKGWRVALSERDHVVFETMLDTPASAGPPGVVAGTLAPPVQTLLRIRADFMLTEGGVVTALRADEVWYAGTPQQWTTDVTRRYRGNLMNALGSLREQWAAIGPAGAETTTRTRQPMRRDASPGATTAPTPDSRARPRGVSSSAATRAVPTVPASEMGRSAKAGAHPIEPEPEPAPAPAPMGVWAYHAEEFAGARGCDLGERGAVLLREDNGTEIHRVYCQGGSTMLVRCDRERCVDGG